MLKKSYCLLIVTLALLALSSNALAQGNKLFQKIAGRWEGTLEYSDYKTEKRVKLKTNLSIVIADDGKSVRFLYLYDDFGKVMKSESAHRIDEASKKYFMGDDEYSFEEKDNQIILFGKQLDNDKLEPVRITITFSPDALTFLKETRAPFAFRNQYTFKRAATFEPEKTLSAVKMMEDFSIFKRAITQLHPGLYRYNTPAEIEKGFNEIESRLKTSLSESDFFKLLSQFASRLRCGHTYLNPLNQTKAVRARLFERRIHFPFYFRLLDRRMIVTGNLSSKKLAVGSEITRINGVSVENVVNELLFVTTADGNTVASRLKSLELHVARENQYQPYDIYFPLFFPLKDEVFEVEAVDYKTKKATRFQVLAMTRAERLAETEKRFGKLPTYDDEWRFEIRNDSIAILKIGNSLTWRLKTIDYKKFIADAFAKMRVKNIRNLIIDWRGNDGGDDDLYVEIVKHLAKKSVPCARLKTRFVRVFRPDKDLSNYIEVFDKQMREFLVSGVPANLIGKRGNDGLYEFLRNEPCESVEPAPNNFKGVSYVISDASNASAAFEFVRAVKENHLATIVGEETGGNLQGINGGNYFLLRLPNSTFEIDIPVYFQTPLTPQKDSGVIPDYPIKPSVSDIAIGTDAELDYIIKKISK